MIARGRIGRRLNAPVRAVPLLRTRWGTLAPADDL